MREKNKARPSTSVRRKTRPRKPRVVSQPVGSGLGFDNATIVAGAETMLRNGCKYDDAALAAVAVYNHLPLTAAERTTWRKLIRGGLRAATPAQDQVFRQRLRDCGARLIQTHPDIAPKVHTAWQAFAAAPDSVGTASVAGTPPEPVGSIPPDPNGIPSVVDLVAVMQESWRRLRLMVEQDPDWYDRAYSTPAGRH